MRPDWLPPGEMHPLHVALSDWRALSDYPRGLDVLLHDGGAFLEVDWGFLQEDNRHLFPLVAQAAKAALEEGLVGRLVCELTRTDSEDGPQFTAKIVKAATPRWLATQRPDVAPVDHWPPLDPTLPHLPLFLDPPDDEQLPDIDAGAVYQLTGIVQATPGREAEARASVAVGRRLCGCEPQDRPRCELCGGSGWDDA